jgi:hypothetical protein
MNRKTVRQRIPPKVAAEVEFRSDRKCCVCGRSDVQIHHLDDDPSDNDFENLINGSSGKAQRLLITFRDQATEKEIGYPQLDDDLEKIIYELEQKTNYPS